MLLDGREAVAAALLLALLLVGCGLLWWQSAGGGPLLSPGEEIPLRDSAAGAPGGSGPPDDAVPPATPRDGSPPAPGADEAVPSLIVHVAGAVVRPGVYTLPPGSRVVAALEAAGGAAPGGVADALNLARPLIDGERICVPTREELDAGGPGPEGVAAGGDGRVDINASDADGLEALPGIGPALARRIVDDRRAHGRFDSLDDLERVSGIGPRVVDGLRPYACAR